jgi:hypothetical protein
MNLTSGDAHLWIGSDMLLVHRRVHSYPGTCPGLNNLMSVILYLRQGNLPVFVLETFLQVRQGPPGSAGLCSH